MKNITNKSNMKKTGNITSKKKQSIEEKKVSIKPVEQIHVESSTKSNEKNDSKKITTKKLPNSGTKQPALQKQNLLFNPQRKHNTVAVRQSNKHLSNLDNGLKKEVTTKLSSTNSSRKNISENNLSSRITTTKYFRQKPVFKKIVQNKDEPKEILKLERSRSKINEPNKKNYKPVRSRSRTLSPSEIKILKNPNQIQSKDENQLDNSKNYENKPLNIENETCNDFSNNDYVYEDDFESYESDFESYSSSKSFSSSHSSTSASSLSWSSSNSSNSDSSFQRNEHVNENSIEKSKPSLHTEEEKKLDSGNYELRESKIIKTLYGIQEAVERENLFITSKNQDISLSDEGFDEKTPSLGSKNFNNFINFEDAKKSTINSKYLQNIKKRGEDILQMITLDTFSETLLEMLPIPYEIYMLNYGRKGTNQVYCQTNDDALSEEIQTDEIELKCKWTQLPIDSGSQFRSINELLHHYQYLQGSGENPPTKHKYNIENIETLDYNDNKLNVFIRSKSQIMMKVLSSKKSKEICVNTNLPFSSTYRKLNTDLTFLKGRAVKIMEYLGSQFTFLLTVHEPKLLDVTISDDEQLLERSMICIWNLFDLTAPNKVLISKEEITSICFEEKKINLIFAGLKNGSLCVWNLNESIEYHKVIVDDSGITYNFRLPSFVTAPDEDINGVISTIKVIKSLNSDDNGSLQICTLSQTGRLLIWSVVNKVQIRPGRTHDPGLAYWGSICLMPGTSIDLQNIFQKNCDLQCIDLQFDSKDSNHLYILTNSAYVFHCLTTGTKTIPKLYKSNIGNVSHATCIEPCPFKQSYFLVGCDDGSIRLHCRNTTRALITLFSFENTTNKNNSIKMIKWSTTKPHHIFAIDSKNILHVWDLELSDIYPVYSIPFKETITAFNYTTIRNTKKSFMIIAFENGKIKIFDINDKFCNKFTKDIEQELRKFLYYVDIL